jgi:hypothetical protein
VKFFTKIVERKGNRDYTAKGGKEYLSENTTAFNKIMLKQSESTLEAFKILQKLVSELYDGIRGSLPKWMPQQFINEFKKIQSSLLIEQKYNPDQIQQYIADYPNYLDNLNPEKVNVKIPDKILDDIDRLWIIKYAIKAGEQKGLALLLGEKTAKSVIHGLKESESLRIGGEKGAAKNKAKLVAIKALAIQVNDALLRSPISARWGLDKRAESIAKKFEHGTIELDGKSTPVKMENGKSYSSETIKSWIIGA